jgi:hypothetical protein
MPERVVPLQHKKTGERLAPDASSVEGLTI